MRRTGRRPPLPRFRLLSPSAVPLLVAVLLRQGGATTLDRGSTGADQACIEGAPVESRLGADGRRTRG